MAYSIDRMPERISIGRETETGVTDVMIDCSAWVRKWPGMTLHAIHTPEGGAPYILQTETDGGVLVWHVTDADTATPGTGRMEIVGEMDGRRKVSAMVSISVAARMPGTVGEPPEAASPWVDSVIEAADRITGMRVQAETLDAGSGATAAWDGVQGLLTIGVPKGEKGEKGDTGAQGPKGEKGADGKDALVDATLTQSGQAADAKVTGDVVSKLKDDVDAKQNRPADQGTPGQVLGLNDDLLPAWVNQQGGAFEYIGQITLEEDSIIDITLPYACSKVLLSGNISSNADTPFGFKLNGSKYTGCFAATKSPPKQSNNMIYSVLIEAWSEGVLRCVSLTTQNAYTADTPYESIITTTTSYELWNYQKGILSLVSAKTYNAGSTFYLYGVRK